MFLSSIIPISENQKINQPGLRTLPKWIKQDFEMHTDEKIVPEDEDFITRVLVDILKYPDKKLSELHKLSHRLGKNDLKSFKNSKNKGQNHEKDHNIFDDSRENIFTEGSLNDLEPFENRQSHQSHSNEICNCCGFTKQTSEISVCESFEEFPIVGISTFLYFRTIINLIIMLALLFLIYGAFGCFVNYYIFVNSQNLSIIEGLSEILSSYNTIFSYKEIEANYLTNDNVTLYTRIDAALIMVMIVLWSILVYVFKHYEVENAEMIDDESVTASDFSIMIQDAPIELFKDFDNVSNQFVQYFRQVSSILDQEYFKIYADKTNFTQSFVSDELQKLQVSKINVGLPFYLNENNFDEDEDYEKLQEALNDHKEKLIEWVNEFFNQRRLTVKVERREKRLQDFKDAEKKLAEKKENFMKNLERLQKQINSSDQMKTTVFITFSTSLCAKIVYELNENTFLSKFSCCENNRMITFKTNNKNFKLNIERAPEPEDIVWENIGFSFWKILSRRFLTYIVTGGILTGSFFLITLLENIQLKSGSSVISVVISASISVLNVAIGVVIYFLTIFEKDITKTNYQASFALKTVFARLVNSIIIPVIVKQDNVYGNTGLVEDVFFLAITTSFLDPILKVLDFYYFFTRIKYWHLSKPNNRIGMGQFKMNKIAEKMEFEVGSEYIYVTNLFLITCFFTPLQPIIPIFSIIGLIMMYWVQKYCLLNRVKRPIPGSDMINTALGEVITLGPIMLATGALVFSDLLSSHGDRNLKFLLHLIAIGIGVLFYLLPFKTIYKMIYSEDEKFVNLNYFESRILLPSEYDRINPSTTKEGMKDFIDYMTQVNQMCTYDQENHQNENNIKLFENLTKFVDKLNQNPNSNIPKFNQIQPIKVNKGPNYKSVKETKNKKLKDLPTKQNINELNNEKNIKQNFNSETKNDKPQKLVQYLRERKKNSINSGMSSNFEKGPYVKEIQENKVPFDLSEEKEMISRKETPFLRINTKNELKKSELNELQDDILQNWPTKESQKIKIPTKNQFETISNKEQSEPYVYFNDKNSMKQNEPPRNRKTQKFNFMKMKNANQNFSNQEAERSNENEFAIEELKPIKNSYPFNINSSESLENKRQHQTEKSKIDTSKNLKSYETNFDNHKSKNDDNILLKERQSLSYQSEKYGFDNQNSQENNGKKMSIPSEKPLKLKSKLFTPSTKIKTEKFEDETDEVDFY